MKIQCDVCDKDEASVFCSADEAALCDACDHRVHHANKLAGKHQRFSLLQPAPKQFPLCDICQERRAFLFCQQDRAILCRDCDLPIHTANEHTQKHNRFLLTGVKLSATSALYSSAPSSSAASLGDNGCVAVPNLTSQTLGDNGCVAVPNLTSQNYSNQPISVKPTIPNPPTIAKTAIATTTTTTRTVATTPEKGLGDSQSGSTSSISEYLIQMLPGWRVEDFLDSSPPPFGLSKTVDDVLPIWDADLESNLSSFSSPENMGIWVPQAPPPLYPSPYPSSNMAFGGEIGFKVSKEATNNKSSRKWRYDGCFAVPQICPPSTVSKRSRTFW